MLRMLKFIQYRYLDVDQVSIRTLLMYFIASIKLVWPKGFFEVKINVQKVTAWKIKEYEALDCISTLL